MGGFGLLGVIDSSAEENSFLKYFCRNRKEVVSSNELADIPFPLFPNVQLQTRLSALRAW